MSSLMRWNPIRDMIAMRDAMDQVFNDRLFRNFGLFADRPAVLPVDAYATDEAIILMADVPGLKPEELSVTFEGDTLTIRGELKPASEQKNYLLRERMVGRFERTLTINTPVDSDKIEATFENGVLTLVLPKAEAVKPKQITVKASGGNFSSN